MNHSDCHGQINLVKKLKKNFFKKRSERSLDERMNICDMFKTQIRHLLARKVAARISAVIAGSFLLTLLPASGASFRW